MRKFHISHTHTQNIRPKARTHSIFTQMYTPLTAHALNQTLGTRNECLQPIRHVFFPDKVSHHLQIEREAKKLQGSFSSTLLLTSAQTTHITHTTTML